jgi:RimJ/RimL family protein N-acetyltransferase
MDIIFRQASLSDKDTIFSWLNEPHVKEFWDNSQEHKEDILNFLHGHKQIYFAGTTKYWIGEINNQPFCFLLSDLLSDKEKDLPKVYRQNLSSNHNISLDFCIGNKEFLGKGLAAITLKFFVEFYHQKIDRKADTFFIDPDENNPRAKHVYEKAGFQMIGDYQVNKGAFVGQNSFLLVKKI